ncbi:MAG TPA: hypothetical protein VL053_05040 [Arachidicoccus sp.]|nr:hypothetical protein [Arachidicoccus sp.]
MRRNRYIILLILALSPFISFAQTDVLQFQNVHLPIGLANNTIRLVEQDKEGLLWIVTVDGLYRYDGQELLHFDLHSTPALPSLPITSLRTDNHGNLWLGFHNGAARFDLKKWTVTSLFGKDWKKASTQDKDISTMACTRQGTVYFGTQSGKIYAVSKSDALQNPNPPLKLILDMSFSRKFGQFNTIMDIQEPVSGQLWIGTGSGMLVNIPVLNHGTSYGKPAYFKPKVAKGHAIANISYDSATGKCLFSAGSLLCIADIQQIYAKRNDPAHNAFDAPWNGAVELVRLPEGEPYNYYSPFYIAGYKTAVLSDGALLPKNIYIYNFRTGIWKLVTPTSPVEFPGKQINSISDKNPTTYISSTGGLTKLQFQDAPVIPILNVLDNNNSIRSIYKDINYLYIGSYRDRFIRYNLSTGKVKHLSEMYVYSMLPWNTDTLLLSTEGNGLFWYKPSINKILPIEFKDYKDGTTDNPFKRPYLTSLCRVNKRLILAGSYHGIALIDPLSRKSSSFFKDSLSAVMQGQKTNAIIPISKYKGGLNNNFLIATNAGVFNANVITGRVHYFLENHVGEKIRDKAVYSLLNMDNQIWMGTNGNGILIADTTGKITASQWLNKQLTSQVVYSMARAGRYVLIGTAKGLNVLKLKDSTLTRYSIYNGLPVDEFNQSAIFNNDSQVYLGTTNGLVYWNSSKANKGKIKLTFHVGVNRMDLVNKNNQQLVSYNMSYLPVDSQRITIASGTKFISITFGSPDDNDSQLDYYYRLKSTDPWIGLGARRMITFVKMHPGDYRLQFAARSPDGSWMEDQDQMLLMVKPAFYQTIWFKLLLGILLVGITLLIFRYREMQLKKERELRMKIAGDLHDEIGSSLTRIWHQVQNYRLHPAASDQETGETERGTNRLEFIAQTSQEAISMMSDMVWSIDAQFDTQQELILRMKSYAYTIQNETGIQLKLIITNESEEKKISQVIRQNLFLLFKEGINNAIKYGDGKPIRITLDFNQKIVMKMENACVPGRAPIITASQGGRGIPNMKRRVAKMNGTLQISQESNTYLLLITI